MNEYPKHTSDTQLGEKVIDRKPCKQKKESSLPTRFNFSQPAVLFRTNKHHPRVRTMDEYLKHMNDTRSHKKAIDSESYKAKKRC
jgi:hypothetical protein